MELETYSQIKTSIRKLLNIELDHYKDEQMRRRLDSWLVRSGAAGWPDYFSLIRQDSAEMARFRDYLTINVSAFSRDPERWNALKELVLPGLLQDLLRYRMPRNGLRIWSAGCSTGQEAYTLAMILYELFPGRRHEILATDLDRGALAKAIRGGPYNQEEIQNLTPQQRLDYLQADGPPYYVKVNLQKNIEFREHNLLQNPFPEDMDLIVCRNVVIYFTNDAKEMLYQKFQRALRPGGVLFVGATEIIPRSQELGFHPFGISFYQKSNGCFQVPVSGFYERKPG